MTYPRVLIFFVSAGVMIWYHMHTLEQAPPAREPARAAPAAPPAPAPSAVPEPPGEKPPAQEGAGTRGSALQPERPRDSREFADRLKQISACYDSEDCDYPQSDPRSYHFAVGQHLRATLAGYTGWVKRERVQEEAVSQTAREFLGAADGHVQEMALQLMATQEPSPENLQAIIDEVLGGHDSKLIALALDQLRRYTSAADQDKITAALAQALSTGAPFLAQEVSARIAPFLNARNSEYFAQVARELPEGSIYRINLEASLKNL